MYTEHVISYFLLPFLLLSPFISPFFISNTQRQAGCIIHIPSASRTSLRVCARPHVHTYVSVCVHVCVCAATITSHPTMQSGKNGSSECTCVPAHFVCLHVDRNLVQSWQLPHAHFAVCCITWLRVQRSERG